MNTDPVKKKEAHGIRVSRRGDISGTCPQCSLAMRHLRLGSEGSRLIAQSFLRSRARFLHSAQLFWSSCSLRTYDSSALQDYPATPSARVMRIPALPVPGIYRKKRYQRIRRSAGATSWLLQSFLAIPAESVVKFYAGSQLLSFIVIKLNKILNQREHTPFC